MDDFGNIPEVVLPGDEGQRAIDLVDKAIAKSGEAANDLDYSDALHQIAEMLAYMDIMILVLTVVVAISLGVFSGYVITQRMRYR